MLLILALTACSLTLPTSGVKYNKHIVPLVKRDCASCHYNGEYGVTLQGVKGDYDQIMLYVNVDSPEASPFLIYPSEGMGDHPIDWPKGSAEYKTILAWIEEGASNGNILTTVDTGDTSTTTTESGDTEPQPISFENDICPELYRDCKSCHGAGQYGVKLKGTPDDYSEVMRYVDVNDPEGHGSFLWWAAGGGSHPISWRTTSDDYLMFLQWVNEGAENN